MKKILFLFLLSCTVSSAQQKTLWYSLIGSAFIDNASYSMLQRLCDEAGGRLVGSPMNERAMIILAEELRKLGCTPELERYSIPGWVRGDDEVRLEKPIARKLRAVALGNVQTCPDIHATLVFARQGYEEDYAGIIVRDRIVLVTSERAAQKPELLRKEAIEIAAAHGARAILFINEHAGGMTLAGMSNFSGNKSPIPAYSLSFEEGKWLQRLVEKQVPVSLTVITKSECREINTANTVVRFPGEVPDKIVVGAHFDSWDVGQGGVDNGIGSAILFELARLIQQFSPKNHYSIELVWFNGEETGLWGSKRYIEMHTRDSIRAMINMDMTGSPTGFTAMGTDTLVPFLRALAERLGGFALSTDIGNVPWTNSDHEPFMLHGIPTITPLGHLEENMVKHYHDLGDSFDKVSKKYLSEAAAVVSILTVELANDRTLHLARRSDEQTINLLTKHKVDERLKKQGEWIFK
jgi:Iap family predicted aminopeptidase